MIREILSTATSKHIPNHKTTKTKQHSTQAKTREVKRNDKIFANPVFINRGRSILKQTVINAVRHRKSVTLRSAVTHLKGVINYDCSFAEA